MLIKGMKYILISIVVFVFVGCGTFGHIKDQTSKKSDASSISRSSLASRLDKIILSNKSKVGSLVALTVRDGKTGDVLYAPVIRRVEHLQPPTLSS